MSGTLNKVMLIGYLGDEVKMHYFDGGNCIGRFPLATNEVYFNKTTNDSINARRIINGTDKAKLISGYYDEFMKCLK